MVAPQSGRYGEKAFRRSATRFIKDDYWKRSTSRDGWRYDRNGRKIDISIIRNERDWAEPDLSRDHDLEDFAIRQLSEYALRDAMMTK